MPKVLKYCYFHKNLSVQKKKWKIEKEKRRERGKCEWSETICRDKCSNGTIIFFFFFWMLCFWIHCCRLSLHLHYFGIFVGLHHRFTCIYYYHFTTTTKFILLHVYINIMIRLHNDKRPESHIYSIIHFLFLDNNVKTKNYRFHIHLFFAFALHYRVLGGDFFFFGEFVEVNYELYFLSFFFCCCQWLVFSPHSSSLPNSVSLIKIYFFSFFRSLFIW